MRLNYFEEHKIITTSILTIIFLFFMIITSEIILQKFLGLGKPVIYDSNPIYGYRPLPDRDYKRFWGKTISFNNLSLRSEVDWDNNIQNKILFLGDSVTYGGSYISNLELFSYLSVKELKNDFISGNAGVNAWG